MIHIEVTDEEVREDINKLYNLASILTHKYNGSCEFEKRGNYISLEVKIDTTRAAK